MPYPFALTTVSVLSYGRHARPRVTVLAVCAGLGTSTAENTAAGCVLKRRLREAALDADIKLTRPADRPNCADGSVAPPSFISPQRGGVVIYNPPTPAHEEPPSVPLDVAVSALEPAFAVFERQLRTLLGAPGTPGRALSSSEVDALAERRLREATKDTVETLAATVKLASEIQNMQISARVQKRVQAALDELDQVGFSALFSLCCRSTKVGGTTEEDTQVLTRLVRAGCVHRVPGRRAVTRVGCASPRLSGLL